MISLLAKKLLRYKCEILIPTLLPHQWCGRSWQNVDSPTLLSPTIVGKTFIFVSSHNFFQLYAHIKLMFHTVCTWLYPSLLHLDSPSRFVWKKYSAVEEITGTSINWYRFLRKPYETLSDVILGAERHPTDRQKTRKATS